MKMLLEIMLFLSSACIGLALLWASENALSPPLLMASKKFHRDSRAEARQVSHNDEENVEDIERMVAHLHQIRVRQVTELHVLQDLMDFSEATKRMIEQLEADTLNYWVLKRLKDARNKVRIFDDRLGARLSEIGRSETRIKQAT